MLRYWVDIEDLSGNRLGDGPLRPIRWSTTRRMDRAGRIEFSVPATDMRASSLLQTRRVARCYAILGGQVTEVGAGIIDQVRVRMGSNGDELVASGDDMLRELTRVLVNPGTGNYAFNGVRTVPYTLIANHANTRLPNSWTLQDKNGATIGSGTDVTASDVYAQFRNETVLNCLIKVANGVGEHFRQETDRTIRWLGTRSDLKNSGVLAITADTVVVNDSPDLALIESIERIEDSGDMANKVFPFGGGNGDVALTLKAASEWPDGTAITTDYHTMDGRQYTISTTGNYLKDDHSITTFGYGVYEKAIRFPITPISNTTADVQNAANQLLRAAYHWLKRHADPQKFYRLRLTNLNRVLRPGETMRVIARRVIDGDVPINLDATVIILAATTSVHADGVRTTSVEVATTDRYPETDAGVVADGIAQVTAISDHSQIGPNVNVTSYRVEFDDSYVADLPFWTGPEITQLDQVLLRFSINPLRSPVKATKGESGHTHDVSLPDHTHGVTVYGVNAPTSNPLARVVYMEPDNLRFVAQFGSGSAPAATTNSGGGSTVASAAGSEHNHAMEYGIFDESSANTYAATDVSIIVAGADRSASIVSTGISGWYELDITQWITEPQTLRPTADYQVITIGPKSPSGKTGLVVAHIYVRARIKS